jgi:DNA-binding LytR/AlgR family response regulator
VKVLIADDEAPARRLLRRLLGELGGIDVVSEATSGLGVLEVIGHSPPDVILLDIEMPEVDGLELAARYAQLPPVVFVTAHDEYAVRAFELGAIDYLLKPVSRERLSVALQRARERTHAAPEAFSALRRSSAPSARVVTHERGLLRFFDARKIPRFHASDKYTAFSLEGEEHLSEEPLSSLEQRLAGHGFVRIHRGELVRLDAIRSLRSEAGVHHVVLEDGQIVKVSRRLLGALRAALTPSAL